MAAKGLSKQTSTDEEMSSMYFLGGDFFIAPNDIININNEH